MSWLDSGLRRADDDVPARRELVHRHEPFAVRLVRVAAGDDEVAGAEMHRHLVEHDFVQVLASRRPLHGGNFHFVMFESMNIEV